MSRESTRALITKIRAQQVGIIIQEVEVAAANFINAAALKSARKDLAAAEKKSAKAAETRASLPPGSSRARVTTANARWSRAAEARDRAAALVAKLVEVSP